MSNERLTLGARLHLRCIKRALAFAQDILCMPGAGDASTDSVCAASATKLDTILQLVDGILAADDAEHLAALPPVTHVSKGSLTTKGSRDGEVVHEEEDGYVLGRSGKELRRGEGGASKRLSAAAINLLRSTTKKPASRRRSKTKRRKPRRNRSR